MAGETSLTRVYNDVLTTAMDYVRPRLADSITSRVPTLHYLNAAGRKKRWPGGVQLHINVFKELTEADLYSDMDTLSTTRPTNFTRAALEWKQAYSQVVVSGRDMLQNGGPTQIVDLLQARLEAAELSLAETLGGSAKGIHSDGTESTTDRVTGLQSIVSASPSVGTIHNISRASNSWWRNVQLSIDTNFSTNGLVQMRSMLRRLTYGGVVPDVVVATGSIFENYQRALTATLNYNLPQSPTVAATGVLDLGIPTVKFFNMDVLYDDFVPANRAYFLNTDYLNFYVSEDRDFVLGEFVQPANGDYIVAHIKWAGELASSALRYHGVLTGSGDTYS